MEQEFINIGWFVATEYTELELRENPPTTPILEKVSNWLTEKILIVQRVVSLFLLLYFFVF